MANKVLSPDRNGGRKDVGANSLVAVYGLPLNVEAGVVNQAGVGEAIEAIAVQDKTFASDNQTTVKAELEYIVLKEQTEIEMDVANGSLLETSVGTLFDIDVNGAVDFATAGTGTALKCVRFISASRGVFIKAK